jgi:hypothetical protein
MPLIFIVLAGCTVGALAAAPLFRFFREAR